MMMRRHLAILSSFALLACGSTDGPLAPGHFPVLHVSGDFIVVPDTSLLVVGTGRRLAVEQTTDLMAYEGRARWTSSNTSVATVDAAGYVRALGEGTTVITVTTDGRSASAPVFVQRYAKPLHFAQVTTGASHACGLTTDGAAYCWGGNASGQLGTTRPVDRCEYTSMDRHGNRWRSTEPCSAVPVRVESDEVFTSIAATEFGACAVNGAGSLFCWGSFGDPAAPLSPAVRVVGGQHAYASVSPPCALTTGGDAYCWGDNYLGTLGTGSVSSPTQASAADPALVSGGHSWREIDARGGTVCGITTADKTYCWGLNNYYQLGVGPDTMPLQCRVACRAAPTEVATEAAFEHVSVGGPVTCALTAAGEAYCSGYRYHRLDAPDPSWTVPTSLGSTRYQAIAAGDFESCAVSAAGATSCWGAGGASAPVLPTSLDPAGVSLPVVMRTVTKPDWASCGIGTDERVYCWGSSTRGMLGDGELPAMGYGSLPESRVGDAVIGQR
ncbi:MAG TPA: Ig-like domain-containing protein [Gemmatimonadaceae bacterium]|nr:Ig-like domain-containing protein [Gemmatimonadaceae bacterium]